jgi:hypothetical protein
MRNSRLRHVAVALDATAEDVGDHLLVGRAVEHFAVVAILEAQHFLAVAVVAAGLAPEIGGLQGGHQDFLRPGGVLFLAHDLFDVSQHA